MPDDGPLNRDGFNDIIPCLFASPIADRLLGNALILAWTIIRVDASRAHSRLGELGNPEGL